MHLQQPNVLCQATCLCIYGVCQDTSLQGCTLRLAFPDTPCLVFVLHVASVNVDNADTEDFQSPFHGRSASRPELADIRSLLSRL